MRIYTLKIYCLTPLLIVCGFVSFTSGATAQEVFGPENLLKNLPNPFSLSSKQEASQKQGEINSPISLPGTHSTLNTALLHKSLAERLVQSQLYLPGGMILGKTAEFTVKGKAGSHVALAMADRDSGAKPIMDHTIHLGPDRKVVAVGTIPPSGILELAIETPIEGDLVGQYLFFEAAVWSTPDFSDMEIATPITPEIPKGAKNGVLITEETTVKHRFFTPGSAVPLHQQDSGGSSIIDIDKP